MEGHDDDKITDQQRKRAEANRLAALAKRKASSAAPASVQNPWKFIKCRNISPNQPSLPKPPQTPTFARAFPGPQSPKPEKFLARLEICSPDSFSVTPVAVEGFVYLGEAVCFEKLSACLSTVVLSHYTQNHGGGKSCVFKLREYDMVLKCLKNSKDIEVEEVPWRTHNVVEKFSHSSIMGQWTPCRPEHLSDEKVNELIEKLPKSLLDVLWPFQLDGVKYGLQRGGRCLIADEMGLGKTLQAIAIAGCFMNDGPILVVCPAILRFSWAEELERWLCLPSDIHLVFSQQNNPANLARCPRIVVTSYTMLGHLRKSMLEQDWALLIIDESHHVRCSKKRKETNETEAILDLASKANRIVLLSGTPSLSRPFDIFHQINMLWPGLLGKDKYEFAKTYCSLKFVQGSEGRIFQDFSKGIRLEELNILLKQTVMIRRLKEHVMMQLPPKRRQLIRFLLKSSDVVSARAMVSKDSCDGYCRNYHEEKASENVDETAESCDCRICSVNGNQILGIAKLCGFREWLSIHSLISGSDGAGYSDTYQHSQKMIIFAHHLKVLDGIQQFICEKGIGFVRIDGNTLARDRQTALLSFKSSIEVKIAIVGLLVGAVGVDFSVAQHVVFLELPQNPAIMQQAEDRAHRHGQVNTVNIYIFCAKDTSDESHWQKLNKSLCRVSSTTNGKYDAIQEIEVDDVSYLERSNKTYGGCVDKSAFDELSTNSVRLANKSAALDVDLIEAHVEVSAKANGRIEEYDENCGKSLKEQNLHIEAECNLSNSMEQSNNETRQAVDADKSCSEQTNSLQFEVSQYTGRIHLYSCIAGTDSRPRPLFESFRPEELELLDCPATAKTKPSFSSITKNPLFRDSLFAFINEWNNLRPLQRRKLCGKPLQLPLVVELCYMEENINHNSGGLLKAGSKRRITPLCDISHPLPSNAEWKKVHLSSGCGRKEKQYTQGRTLKDEPLCKLCQKPCINNNAKAPEFFEDLFCNLGCYEEYRLRTSNQFLRKGLFEIEHGICTICQLDCHKLVQDIKPLSIASRQVYVEKVAAKIAGRKKLLEKLVIEPIEGNAWHADHIIPVYRGGGECRLENMRTLCVACHFDVTAAQRTERRLIRMKARKQLKVLITDLGSRQEQGHSKMEAADLLSVQVPGSAYSKSENTSTGCDGLELNKGEGEQIDPSKIRCVEDASTCD